MQESIMLGDSHAALGSEFLGSSHYGSPRLTHGSPDSHMVPQPHTWFPRLTNGSPDLSAVPTTIFMSADTKINQIGEIEGLQCKLNFQSIGAVKRY